MAVSEERWWVLNGDCREVLKECQDNYFDAMVTDPPAGIDFMHRDWDCFRRRKNAGRSNVMDRMSEHAPHSYGESDRDLFVAFMTEVMRECYRVLKTGAHAFVWALPRTSSWTCRALEDAGFEVRHIVHHHFGNGFPKSQDVGKFIDKLAGAEREVVGRRKEGSGWKAQDRLNQQLGFRPNAYLQERTEVVYTAPATDAAKEWDGWGTALKPATEHWILARKPLSESSIARNVLKHGTGALNIDACRVERAAEDVPGWHGSGAKGSGGYQGEDTFKIRDMSPKEIQERCGDKGRWPPDLVLSHSEGCRLVGTRRISVGGSGKFGGRDFGEFTDQEAPTREIRGKLYRDDDFKETIDDWECVPGCPVAELDRQSGITTSGKMRAGTRRANRTGYTGPMPEMTAQETYGDSGGASRFFPTFHYFPKPSRAEREAGCEDLPSRVLNRVNSGGLENEPRWSPKEVKNNHPTVKGMALMTWLIQLITRPEGIILDPFCGSGSTGAAAVKNGYRFIGIDQSEEYCQIARARIRYWDVKRQCEQ